MSQLKLTADGGGGTVAIKGPASTTGNNAFELTVPGTASGTILTSNSSVGKILQVKQTVKDDVTSTTSTSFAAISGMSVDITPIATSSKVLLMVDLKIGGDGAVVQIRFKRGTNSIYTGNNSGANFNDITMATYGGGDTGSGFYDAAFAGGQFLDSPNTTSQVTYAVHWARQNSATAYLNRTGNDGGNYSSRMASSITVMEVAA